MKNRTKIDYTKGLACIYKLCCADSGSSEFIWWLSIVRHITSWSLHFFISKNTRYVTNAMSHILNRSNRIPKKLVTDNGKEYYNTSFESLMKDHNIHHYSTFSPLKAFHAERVIRTVKEKLFRLFTLNGNHKWIDLH